MDALSEVLRLASLSGSVLADVTAGGSWCVSVPVAPPPVPVRRGGASRRLAGVFAARCAAGA